MIKNKHIILIVIIISTSTLTVFDFYNKPLKSKIRETKRKK